MSRGPEDPPSVLFVLPLEERFDAQRGGAISTMTRELAARLAARGHRVRVAAVVDGDPPYDVVPVHRLRRVSRPSHPAVRFTRRVAGRLSPGRFGALVRYRRDTMAAVSQDGCDAVIVANDPLLAIALATRWPGRLVVLWLHNWMIGREAAALPTLPSNVRVVAVSEALASTTSEQTGLPRERISVIYNGIRHEDFFPRVDHSVPRDPVRVICHGRIDPNKGQLLAARAVARLRHEGLAVALSIVGSVQTFGQSDEVVGRYRQELERAIDEAGAHAPGRVPADEVAPLLRDYDVACVLTLVPDPFNLAALEAMASGLAVVAVPLGGVAETVGTAGILVDPEVDEVVTALRDLVCDPVHLTAAKSASIRQARRFDLDASVTSLQRLLDTVPVTSGSFTR